MIQVISLFWMMLVGHAVCDYPLQGDFLARGKNHRAPLPGVPWWICLAAHAIIHGGAVSLITGTVTLGVAETVLHMVIDYLKCEGLTDLVADQILHIGCKALWVLIVMLPGKVP